MACVVALGCQRFSSPDSEVGRAQLPGGSEAVPKGADSCPHDRQRERARLALALQAEGIKEARVLDAFRRVPRHWFVPRAIRDEAYEDRPLPIGHDQTISQPYIVAAMTEAAAPGPRDKCLEIGTGSGYQAAILAELCKHTYSIEYLPEVARFGAQNLRRCGYGPDRVSLRVGDGFKGWPAAAPFDVVLVTAAPEAVPAPLLDQLAVGGRLVVPVGRQRDVQTLELWTRLGPGSGQAAFRRLWLMDVRFVPMLGEAAPR
jgi:protein-L-isoaspartate(D-aspartate) O-methyltransferase